MADKVKIEIQTTADTSGATQTEQALAGIGKVADKDVDSLKQLQEEMAATFAKQKERINNLPGASAGPSTGSSVAGITPVADVAQLTKQALQVVGEFLNRLSEGTARASEMAQSLEGLDEASRKAAVEGMGPLGKLIEEGGTSLANFEADAAAATGKINELWTSIGSRLAPALDQTAQSIAAIDTTKLGSQVGDVLGGMVDYFNTALSAVKGFGDQLKSATGISEEYLWSLGKHVPIMGGIITALERYTQASQSNIAAQKDAALSASAYQERLQIGIELEKQRLANAQARADSELPVADQIAKLEEKKNEAHEKALSLTGKPARAAANEVLQLEAQIAALEKKQRAEEAAENKQKEADDQRKQSQADANEDYTRRIALQEATTAGDQERVDFLKQEIAYRQALKATGDPDRAQRAKTAVFDEQEKRRADAEAKAKADAEKSQAAVDKKSQAAEEAYKKEQEAIAKKREALDLQTRFNEAKATGNKKEEEAIKWLEIYNRILEQTDSSGNNIYTEEQARRAANAQAAVQNPTTSAYVPPSTNPGDVLGGTNFRRGRDQSDSSFAMSEADANMGGPGGSLLDAYNKTKGLPVGSTGGNDPTKSTNPNSDIKGAADKSATAITQLSKEASSGFEKISSTVVSAVAPLKAAIAAANAKIDALSSKV